MFDRVLVERLASETVSKGGIMIPEKSQAKVQQATVVAVGPGSTNKVTHYFLDLIYEKALLYNRAFLFALCVRYKLYIAGSECKNVFSFRMGK